MNPFYGTNNYDYFYGGTSSTSATNMDGRRKLANIINRSDDSSIAIGGGGGGGRDVGFDFDGVSMNAQPSTSQMPLQGTNSRASHMDHGVFAVPQHPVRSAYQKRNTKFSGTATVPQESLPQRHFQPDGMAFSAKISTRSDMRRPLSDAEVQWAFEGVSDLRYFGDPKFQLFVSSLP
ncbi:unnamed protein product [Hydatigera taeniaeformis]|uniref:Uncharacterized protein n=1 Tax=Hydatigena taeniaeformis TaxID=6205 RepID=A0A0R3X284_HYDTA|nr:unnamed protein product [Hydatigera taeniaeformis]